MRKTDERKKEEVVRLYKAQKHTIKEIMRLTGVRSEQTIYMILNETNTPRLKIRKAVKHLTISIDAELLFHIDRVRPKNISKWVCDMAKLGIQNYRQKE